MAMGVQAALFQEPRGKNPFRPSTKQGVEWLSGYNLIAKSWYAYPAPKVSKRRSGKWLPCRNCGGLFPGGGTVCSRRCWVAITGERKSRRKAERLSRADRLATALKALTTHAE